MPNEPEKKPEAEVPETAVLLIINKIGDPAQGNVNVPMKMKRKSTFEDMYHMVCDVKAQLEALKHANLMTQFLAEGQMKQKHGLMDDRGKLIN